MSVSVTPCVASVVISALLLPLVFPAPFELTLLLGLFFLLATEDGSFSLDSVFAYGFSHEIMEFLRFGMSSKSRSNFLK